MQSCSAAVGRRNIETRLPACWTCKERSSQGRERRCLLHDQDSALVHRDRFALVISSATDRVWARGERIISGGADA
jgi:signal-transduction protein with cAMP-binding, CBS, and nucleotidyltransferase domain